eukprot:257463-Chlamydomonas_euryale.AAC.1
MTRLADLNLATNALSGTLPEVWSTLSSLTRVDLASNAALHATLPTAWPAGMPAMASLSVVNNAHLCGALPAPWTTAIVSTAGSGLGAPCPSPPPPPPSPPSPSPPPPSTGNALYDLVVSAGGTWPTALFDWTAGGDPCGPPAWTGVLCMAGQPTSVEVTYASLAAALPASWSVLTSLQVGCLLWAAPLNACGGARWRG